MASHEPQPFHADIRITRIIAGEEIVSVGFIKGDDPDGCVDGDIMFERVRAAGFKPIEDSVHLEAHKGEWADDPVLALFYVVTNERHPEFSRHVRCFDRVRRERGWLSLDYGFDRDVLVVCRAQ